MLPPQREAASNPARATLEAFVCRATFLYININSPSFSPFLEMESDCFKLHYFNRNKTKIARRTAGRIIHHVRWRSWHGGQVLAGIRLLYARRRARPIGQHPDVGLVASPHQLQEDRALVHAAPVHVARPQDQLLLGFETRII